MYVGITRAQRDLTLTYAKTRFRQGRAQETLLSRFVFELKGEPPPREWQRAVAAAGSKTVLPIRTKRAPGRGRPRRRTRR